MLNYLDLPIGAAVIDGLWVRLPVWDKEATYPDNHYYAPTRCYCNNSEGYSYDGINDESAYTYSDENGPCDFCSGDVRQVFSHNDTRPLDSVRDMIQDYLTNLQSGSFGVPTMEQLENAGNLHAILEGEYD